MPLLSGVSLSTRYLSPSGGATLGEGHSQIDRDDVVDDMGMRIDERWKHDPLDHTILCRALADLDDHPVLEADMASPEPLRGPYRAGYVVHGRSTVGDYIKQMMALTTW